MGIVLTDKFKFIKAARSIAAALAFIKKRKNMRFLISLILISISINTIAQFNFEIIDTNPNEDSYVWDFTIYNNKLFFAATDSIYDYELWISDGTIEGTFVLKDINPTSYSNPEYLTVFNNRLYFSADDGIHGKELWVTDGTTEGTSLFLDINEMGSSEPKYLKVCDGKLFFSADDGVHGIELWISEGTPENTYLLKDINTTGNAKPVSFMPLSNKLLFWANESAVNNENLWVTDGTLSGTNKLKDINKLFLMQFEKFAYFDNKVFFGAEDSINGREFWCSDGSPSGTYMVKDINPFQYSWGDGQPSFPDHFFVYNSKIYFSAIDGIHSEELWVSDGTTDGTILFKDINPNGLSNPTSFSEFNGKLYFGADDGIHGKELWCTNGNIQETFMLKDINPYGNSNPTLLSVNAEKLFFKAAIMEGGNPLTKLFVSNGSEDGTYFINPEYATNQSPLSTSYEFCVYDNKLFFNAAFTSSIKSLWVVSDTTYVSVEEVSTENLVLYPNPTKGRTFIKSTKEMTIIEITDLYGELVFNWNGKSTYVKIDLKSNKSGIYFVNIYVISGECYLKKIIRTN
jgi:ELWxxDGT repeat protein